MAEELKSSASIFIDNLAVLTTPEGIQKYIFGNKKNGTPRALYDILKDIYGDDCRSKKKKKKHKKDNATTYEFYLDTKKKKKHKKHWHI